MQVNGKYSLYGIHGQRKYLTIGERSGFFHAAKKVDEPSKRLFLLMLYYTGARISEVLNLKKRHIDVQGKCVVIESLKKRKTGVFRGVPIPDGFLGDLVTYGNASNHHKLWCCSRSTAWRLVKAVMQQAEIEGVQACAKGLRHSFAVCAIENNVPLNVIKKWMGHSSIVTTSIYLNVIGEEERSFAERMWGALWYK